MAELRFLLLALLMPNLAGAQVGTKHGTVVVLNITDDKLIVAADSLAIPDFGKPDYSYCKIITFSHQIVFAGVGSQAYIKAGPSDLVAGWSAKEILRQVIESEPNSPAGKRHIQAISGRWAAALLPNFQSEYLWHPQDVIKLAEQGKGTLSGGIFAEAGDGAIYMSVAIITLNQNWLVPMSWSVGDGIGDCWTCGEEQAGKICAGGQTAITGEFCTGSTERAKGQEGKLTYGPNLLNLGWDRYSLLALRLADLTAAYDRTQTVGGDIDVVELDKNGHIRWLARKVNCPDNEN